MNYTKLKAELDSNTALYSTMSDLQVAQELNAADKPQNRASMSRQEIIAAINPAELEALTGDVLVRVFGVLSDSVDPFGVAQSVFVSAFGGLSATITALAAARVETVSRASQLNISNVAEGDVTNART